MSYNCDIVIFTARFGNGHMSVTNSINDALLKKNSDLNIKIVDFFELVYPNFYEIQYKAFEFSVKNTPKLYKLYYQANDKFNKLEQKIEQKAEKKDLRNPFKLLITMQRLDNFLKELKPRVILSTFPTCTRFISRYKQMMSKDITLCTCITDVVDKYEWIAQNNDIYFVPTEDIKDSLMLKGIDEKKLIVTGIPVKQEFYDDLNYNIVHEPHNINVKEEFTILLMGGGMGVLPEDEEFYEWISKFEPFRILIVTGNNKQLYNKLKKFNKKSNIQVLGYCEFIPKLMKKSNVIVTKPGGITLFESIASKLPLIVFNTDLGQEIENAKYIQSKGIGYVEDSKEGLKERLVELYINKKQYNNIVCNIEKASKNMNMDILVETLTEEIKKSSVKRL